MGSSLYYLPLPLTITLPRKIRDSHLQAFCASNEPYPTDFDGDRKLTVRLPKGKAPEMDWGSYLYLLPVPFTIVTSRPFTDDEFIRFSRGSKHLRMEKNTHGEIVVMDMIGLSGSERRWAVVKQLLDWAEKDGRGEASGGNVGWNLADGSTLSPDASWTSKERLGRFTKKEHEGFLPIAPDFVVEILAKGDPLRKRQAKMQQWLENGAQLGWLIDPFRAAVHNYRPGKKPEMLQRPGVLEGDGPIAGFRLNMERFWA
jgi:Uma2 family endonuclease